MSVTGDDPAQRRSPGRKRHGPMRAGGGATYLVQIRKPRQGIKRRTNVTYDPNAKVRNR